MSGRPLPPHRRTARRRSPGRLAALLLAATLTPAQAQPDSLDAQRVAGWLAATSEDPGPLEPAPRVEVLRRRATVRFSAGGAECGLRLFPISEAGPGDMAAASVGMHREGEAGGACGELVSRAVNRIQAHDVRRSQQRAGLAPEPPPPAVLLLLGAALLALLPLGLLAAATCLRGPERALLALLALVSLAVRALAPHRRVMVYFGYKHVAEAVDLSTLPR